MPFKLEGRIIYTLCYYYRTQTEITVIVLKYSENITEIQ
jgi:hypothetical protein